MSKRSKGRSRDGGVELREDELGELRVKNVAPAVPSAGLPQPWAVGEAVGAGFGGIKTSPMLLVAHFFVSLLAWGSGVVGVLAARRIVAQQMFEAATSRASGGVESPAMTRLIIGSAIGVGFFFLIGAAFDAGLCRMQLAAARGEDASLGMLLSGVRRAPTMLVIRLVRLLVAIPSVLTLGIVEKGFALAPYFAVDFDMGPIEALGASWAAASGHKGSLWLLDVALGPTRIAATGLFGIGWALTESIHGTGIAYAYTRVTGTNPRPSFEPEYASRVLNALLRATLTVSAIAFACAVYAVQHLPAVRGSAWTPQDALVRALAIVLGTTTTVALLATLLPWLLDRLEGRTFTMFVAARHVRSQKSGFLTVISILSICGVALSSCALSTVISVMGGFSQDLKRKILGNNAHIVIDTVSQKPFDQYDGTLDAVRKVPGVAGATPVVQGEVMVSSASNLAGVIVKGVDTASIGNVIELPRIIEVGQFDYLANPDKLQHLPPTEVICIGPGGEQYTKGAELSFLADDLDPAVKAAIDTTPPYRPGIIIGRELGKTLHVCVGDEVTLVSPLGDLGPVGVMPRTKKFRVAGIFYSGMYEYDASHVYTTIDEAQEYFSAANKVSAIDVRVEDGERADQLTPLVTAAVGRQELRVRDWREMNHNLFSALKLERVATFTILLIAIMVASFCIICTLLLMVTEKGKEIAILKALGSSDGAILRTFMTEGVIIGAIGTVFGVATGLSLCSGLLYFGLRLNPDIYYIDKLPIQVEATDFAAVAAAAFIICTLATIYPAYAASKLRPVEGLRYE